MLDPGETAALAVVNAYDAILVTDDLAARDTATSVGVEVHGSTGIIARGYVENRLDQEEAAALVRALQHETSLFLIDGAVEQGLRYSTLAETTNRDSFSLYGQPLSGIGPPKRVPG